MKSFLPLASSWHIRRYKDGPESPHPNLFAATQATEGAEEDRAIGTRVMGHPSGTILGGFFCFQKAGWFLLGEIGQKKLLAFTSASEALLMTKNTLKLMRQKTISVKASEKPVVNL